MVIIEREKIGTKKVDVSEYKCMEIDFPEDLKKAEEEIKNLSL